MKPLYIWAGGKTKMLKHYQSEISNLKGVKTLVEPFFGGGAFTIHMKDRLSSIEEFVINDIKSEIIDIYKSIKQDPKLFIEMMDKFDSEYIPLNKTERKEYYYDIRHKFAYDFETMSEMELSTTLYFMMRTCFNGIWQINQNTNNRFGTPCGLLDQTDSVYDKENVKEWSEFLQRVTLQSKDWEEVSREYDKEDTLFFLDPPYRDSFTTYGGEFGDDQQKRVIDFCNQTNGYVMLTNRDEGDGFFDNHINKDKLNIKRIPVTYTAGRRKKTEDGFEAKPATEVLIYSKTLDNIFF
jgi:DNA adenine methylase